MRRFISVVALIVPLMGCPDDKPAGQTVSRNDVVATYAELVYLNYVDAHTHAVRLNTAVERFLDTPNAARYEYLKRAWLDARVSYGQTEAFRFHQGPIDNAETGLEPRINPWPLDERFIDYTATEPQSGIINDTTNYPDNSITRETLIGLNGSEAREENVATGYHAIEFLLWGQDTNTFGPGTRPFTDYTTAPNAARRARYLREVSALLVSDLETLVSAWSPDAQDNHRAAFLKENADTNLRKMLISLGTLSKGELAGERMDVALSSGDQEDEHSCFSDNTHVDIAMNQQGIRNVYFGHYRNFAGTSLSALVASIDSDLDEQVRALLDASSAAIARIEPPFDAAIISDDGKARIDAAVAALRAQADELVVVGKTLGLGSITTDLE